ncbi:MAG: LCP family protein, partial [Acidimicrobiia bacterium]|nr:LCP family protein [Acidimicrobiia bacterium]
MLDDRPRIAPLDDSPGVDRLDAPDRQTTPTPSQKPGWSRRRRIILGVLAVFLILAAYPAWNAASIWNDWRNVERETFDSAAFERLPAVQAPTAEEEEGLPEGVTLPAPVAAAPTGPTTYENFLIVGLDRSELRSDVIIMAMLPSDESPPIMVSLPRDLYIPNRCTGGLTRINANFNGCGDINGATALAGAVKDFTGYQIDHFAIFTFDGFAAIIDQFGGFEVCLDRPLRERPKFELPAGCTLADGATTLGWVRSRKTEEFVDGQWRRIRTSSDFNRQARQQDLILTVFERVADFKSPKEMTALVGS